MIPDNPFSWKTKSFKMRMNIQPRVVGERIDYITEEVKYICIQGGRLDLYP
jgi:hypothetical protein